MTKVTSAIQSEQVLILKNVRLFSLLNPKRQIFAEILLLVDVTVFFSIFNDVSSLVIDDEKSVLIVSRK